MGTVGYVIRRIGIPKVPVSNDGASCRKLEIQAELVSIDRRIVVASDLSATPCRLRVTIEHYMQHATAASVALHLFASTLSRTLGPEIDGYLRTDPGLLQTRPDAVHRFVDSLLDQAVGSFSASLRETQNRVDSVSEVRKLSVPCSET